MFIVIIGYVDRGIGWLVGEEWLVKGVRRCRMREKGWKYGEKISRKNK